MPKSLGFLRDTSVAMSLTMVIFFFIVAPFAGKEFIEKRLSGGVNFLVFSLMQGITFATGVYVVLAGVRMLIAGIVPAFKGIADKVVQDAKPALDCPVVFPYAPNAVIVGFLSSFAAGIISMFILPLVGLKVIVPGLIPHFFTGAAAGVFGNAIDEAPFLEHLPTEFSSRSYQRSYSQYLGLKGRRSEIRILLGYLIKLFS